MALTLNAEVGATDANSYVTVAEATAYFEGRLNASPWTDADGTDSQEKALVSATRRLDEARFKGSRSDEDQALEWPRSGTYTKDGLLIDDDVIPVAVQDATCELALALLASDEDLLAESGLESFKSVTIGPISVSTRPGRSAGSLPQAVKRKIRHLLRAGASGVAFVRG